MVNARVCCKWFTVSLVPVTVFCLATVFLGGIVVLPTLYVELAKEEQVWIKARGVPLLFVLNTYTCYCVLRLTVYKFNTC